MTRDANAAIHIDELSVHTEHGDTLVAPWSATIHPGETLALIGESGSGKTLSAKALIGLLDSGLRGSGRVVLDGRGVDLSQPPAAWRGLRGPGMTLVLQDPFTSLSPVHTVGTQIGWTLDAHGLGGHRRERQARIEAALRDVRLPVETAHRYPHQLSGGMRQRAAIAAALVAEPQLIIADEPTTALDASNQAGILDLLHTLKRDRGISVMLITHDLSIVREYADQVLVMRAGEIVERGNAGEVLARPQHAYTQGLCAADPMTELRAAVTAPGEAPSALRSAGHGGNLDAQHRVAASSPSVARANPATEPPVLDAQGIEKSYDGRTILRGVDLTVQHGEIVGIVGESGSGKSTLMRCIAGLESEDAGSVTFAGTTVRPGRRDRTIDMAQIVFQDPYSSLNPTYTVRQTLAEALRTAKRPVSDAAELLRLVGLNDDFLARRPGSLSGGQRQRVAIARALAPRPSLLICDESVSALDVSVQATILDLLRSLRDETGQAIVLVSHDLGVVLSVTDRVMVLNDGRIIESGPSLQVLRNPQHEYTRMLTAAALGQRASNTVAPAGDPYPAAPAPDEPPSSPRKGPE